MGVPRVGPRIRASKPASRTSVRTEHRAAPAQAPRTHQRHAPWLETEVRYLPHGASGRVWAIELAVGRGRMRYAGTDGSRLTRMGATRCEMEVHHWERTAWPNRRYAGAWQAPAQSCILDLDGWSAVIAHGATITADSTHQYSYPDLTPAHAETCAPHFTTMQSRCQSSPGNQRNTSMQARDLEEALHSSLARPVLSCRRRAVT